MTATKDRFFKPEKVDPRAKAATTDSIARSIIEAEAVARDKKTEALRALRLEREANAEPQGATAEKSGRKAKVSAKRG